MTKHRRRVLSLALVVAGSHHRDHTTTFAEPSKPNEPALTAADDRVNHAPRMRVRSGLEEPVHRLNKPFLGTHDAFVGGPYIPMAW